MDLNFKNKVVIITGGASGIGEAAALGFAKEGASVVIADVQIDRAEALVSKINSEGGVALFVKCDVSNESEIRNLINTTIDKFGKLDCAFNNAGIEGTTGDTTLCTEENWDRVININLRGIWQCMKYQIPEMIKNGGGNIVNCSSIAGIVGFSGIPAYTASKHGVIGLTQTAALEFANKNIRVNAICPGVIDTPMIERFTQGDSHARELLISEEPMARLGRPDKIANIAIWLCSNASSYVTGHPLVADGGWVAK